MKHNPETPRVHYNAWTKIKYLLSKVWHQLLSKKLYVQSQMVIVKSLLT